MNIFILYIYTYGVSDFRMLTISKSVKRLAIKSACFRVVHELGLQFSSSEVASAKLYYVLCLCRPQVVDYSKWSSETFSI